VAYLIGIDIGTSSTKALLCTDEGRVVASAVLEYGVDNPQPLWSEQDPERWWAATVDTVKAVMDYAKIPGTEIGGIGLTGQMHGAVFMDADNNVLRPAILWNDQRTATECVEITEKAGGRDKLIGMVSNPALTGFTAPKILWVRKNEPEIYARVRKVLLPKDYIRFRMTGQFATDVSDASGTLLLDVKNRRWSDEMLQKLEIDRSLLPDCFESTVVSGKVTEEAAAEMGIAVGVPVVGGGGDQAAGAVGNGIVRPGVISATLGTSGVVFAFADTPAIDPQGRAHTFCHAAPGKWHVMGVMLSAGGSLQWFRNNLGEMEREQASRMKIDAYEILCEEAEDADPGCEGLVFLPYLTGERTPHANPNARGAWIGLTTRHGRAHMIRSIMEGVTFGMKDSLQIMRELGIPIGDIRCSGGGARSEFWLSVQADVYESPVCTINATDGPAFGAALLAGVGTGAWSSVEEACDSTINVISRTEPNEANYEIYRKSYAMFRKLYNSLREDFDIITSLAK